jgi:hypothetical protein
LNKFKSSKMASVVDPEIKPFTSTLLSRIYLKACFISFSIYGILQALLYYNRYHSGCPLCELSSHQAFSSWTRDVNLLVVGAFATSACLQFSRLNTASFGDDYFGIRASSCTTLCINLIATLSNASLFYYDWGGVCEDMYGYPITSLHFVIFLLVS